jgi:hypothetical protein
LPAKKYKFGEMRNLMCPSHRIYSQNPPWSRHRSLLKKLQTSLEFDHFIRSWSRRTSRTASKGKSLSFKPVIF